MRPTGRNRRFLLGLLEQAREQGWPYVEFMLHSSELMPGGSPTFRNEASIEKLYDDLEALFEAAAGHFEGSTTSEFRESWVARHSPLDSDGGGEREQFKQAAAAGGS